MNNLALHVHLCRCLQKKMMFFGGSCNGSDGGVGGGGWGGLMTWVVDCQQR